MNKGFVRFKRKARLACIIKSLLYGFGMGFVTLGILLILTKTTALPINPLLSIPISIPFFLVFGGLAFLLLRKTDKRIAYELDDRFKLKEKVQTMVAYQEKGDSMHILQREDTEKALAEIQIRDYTPKRLWISILVCVLGLALLITGLAIENKYGYADEPPVVPFAMTEIQKIALEDLIKYVEESDMAEPYRTQTRDELQGLYSTLLVTTTQPEMVTHVSNAMYKIQTIRNNSYTVTELKASLKSKGADPLKLLIKVIESEDIEVFDLAKGELREYFSNEDNDKAPVKTNLTLFASDLRGALDRSGIDGGCELYKAIERLLTANESDLQSGEHLYGVNAILEKTDTYPYAWLARELDSLFETVGNEIYSALLIEVENKSVGSYAIKRLGEIFGLPLPAEPENEDDEDDKDKTENDGTLNGEDENKGTGGGFGTGAVFGSDDMIYDYKTDTYVKYGDVIDDYYALMMNGMLDGQYTEEEAVIIARYYQILYSGLEDAE